MQPRSHFDSPAWARCPLRCAIEQVESVAVAFKWLLPLLAPHCCGRFKRGREKQRFLGLLGRHCLDFSWATQAARLIMASSLLSNLVVLLQQESQNPVQHSMQPFQIWSESSTYFHFNLEWCRHLGATKRLSWHARDRRFMTEEWNKSTQILLICISEFCTRLCYFR